MQIQRLNDGDFLVHIECDLRLVHERKMFVAKDENGELRNPENVPILVRLGRGRKMIEMLGSGTYHNKKEIAGMFGMSLPNVSRTIRSAFLSPVIVDKLVSAQSHSHASLPCETRHVTPLGRTTRSAWDRVADKCLVSYAELFSPHGGNI